MDEIYSSCQNKDVYNAISGQVETFLYAQGFSKVTLQPEFPSSPHEDRQEMEVCNLKCKVTTHNSYTRKQ